MGAGPLTTEQANAIYDVLVELADAKERVRTYFVSEQIREHVSEYRFQGNLGFGGKFWRNPGFLSDGTWGERWYVNCYREDETPARLDIIANTNYELELLRERFQ